ncbi:hypothetical protein B0H17DRAFT_1194704 [Mycena rosella]|uniref:Uncharacterized protein n=1 Tax=Mycena rosella TaxID=1033263 RepID=A0AAD7GQS4_MYCRO|nr:hypothetical protein B0H17DRAFT_1194704 [Mycena rosella]
MANANAEQAAGFRLKSFQVLSFAAPLIWSVLLFLLLDSVPHRQLVTLFNGYKYIGTMQICVVRILQESGIFFALLSLLSLGFGQGLYALDASDGKAESGAAIVNVLVQALPQSPNYGKFSGSTAGLMLYYLCVLATWGVITCLILPKILISLFSSAYSDVVDDAEAQYLTFFVSKTISMIRAPDSYVYPAPVLWIIQNITMCAIKARPNKVVDQRLPHITIQMPIYKESLETVLAPFIELTIFINDDGLWLLPVPDRDERLAFYTNHNTGWVARPKHNDSAGGFRRARAVTQGNTWICSGLGNSSATPMLAELSMGFPGSGSGAFELGIPMPHWMSLALNGMGDGRSYSGAGIIGSMGAELGGVGEDLEERALGLAIEEMYETGRKYRPWAANGKDVRLGEYILIDCLRDTARKMTECPTVAILQHESDVIQVAHHYVQNSISCFTRQLLCWCYELLRAPTSSYAALPAATSCYATPTPLYEPLRTATNRYQLLRRSTNPYEPLRQSYELLRAPTPLYEPLRRSYAALPAATNRVAVAACYPSRLRAATRLLPEPATRLLVAGYQLLLSATRLLWSATEGGPTLPPYHPTGRSGALQSDR